MFVRPVPALLALSLVVSLGGCDRASGPLQSRENVFAYSAPLAPGATAFVRTMRGSIDVEPSPDDTLRVIAGMTWRGRDEPPTRIELTGSQVAEGALICARWDGGKCTTEGYTARSGPRLRGAARSAAVQFRVLVPAGVKLHLLGIDTRITSASTASVYARSLNGDVTVVTASGPVQAESMNGSVDARMTTLTGSDSVIVKTMNGDAWAFLPELADATVDASTMNGSVETDFAALTPSGSVRKSLRGSIGVGGTPVYVRSMNGSVGVRRLDAEGRSYQR